MLLECRLQQKQSQLEEARAEADRARAKLAEAVSREADQARRFAALQEELADARAEITALHRRLERSEAMRVALEGQLFHPGAGEDASELVRLRREVLVERQRAQVHERAVTRLKARVEELLASRDTLLTRVAQWQQLVRDDGPEAADMSQYLSELRREILDLEHRNAEIETREAALRRRLAAAGLDPDVEPIVTFDGSAASQSGPDIVAASPGAPGPGGAQDVHSDRVAAGDAALAAADVTAAPVSIGVGGGTAAGELDSGGLYFSDAAEDDAAAGTERVAARDDPPAAPAVGTTSGSDLSAAGGAAEAGEGRGQGDPTDVGPVHPDPGASVRASEAASDAQLRLDEVSPPPVVDGDDAGYAAAPATGAETPRMTVPASPGHVAASGNRPDGGAEEERRVTTSAAVRPARIGTESLVAALSNADVLAVRARLRPALDQCGPELVLESVLPWTSSELPAIRAAAYEALGLIYVRDGAALEPYLRPGLEDPDPRVRRRVVLAAASARGLPLRSFLGPVRDDPDPQVRRVVREVLRHAPTSAARAAPDRAPDADGAALTARMH